MILFDMGLPVELMAIAGLGLIIFFLLVFAAIAFFAYKLLKRKK